MNHDGNPSFSLLFKEKYKLSLISPLIDFILRKMPKKKKNLYLWRVHVDVWQNQYNIVK